MDHLQKIMRKVHGGKQYFDLFKAEIQEEFLVFRDPQSKHYFWEYDQLHGLIQVTKSKYA